MKNFISLADRYARHNGNRTKIDFFCGRYNNRGAALPPSAHR